MRSIFSTDFDLVASGIRLDKLDNLYEQALTIEQKRPEEDVAFTLFVRPNLPEEGLRLQVSFGPMMLHCLLGEGSGMSQKYTNGSNLYLLACLLIIRFGPG